MQAEQAVQDDYRNMELIIDQAYNPKYVVKHKNKVCLTPKIKPIIIGYLTKRM